MADPMPDPVRAFLGQPNPAVMATLARHGRPVSVATWYLRGPSGRVLLNLDAERVRLAHLRRDPRVSLTALDDGSWYNHVSLRLDVVEIQDDPDLADIDALSFHNGGSPYLNRERPRVSARAEIRSWHAWGTRFADLGG